MYCSDKFLGCAESVLQFLNFGFGRRKIEFPKNSHISLVLYKCKLVCKLFSSYTAKFFLVIN